jgi:tetratricopeptide (TPR) repeat protein
MIMKAPIRTALAAIAATIASFASAQSATEEQRLDAILYAAHERLDEQQDEFFRIGDFPRSINILRVIVEVWPNDRESVETLGWLLESTEQKGEALARYISYKKNNPGDPDAPQLEAFFYLKNKLYAKVPPLLEPTLKLKPHQNAYRQLARAYEKMEMYADSKRVLETFLDDYPNEAQAKVNLERVEKKLKAQEEANP